MSKKKKILIFGVGGGAKNAAPRLGSTLDVVAFLDNDPQRQGRRFQGKPVHAPSAVNDLTWDEIHIASTSYYRAMADQLLNLGVPENKIHAVATDVLQAERTGCSLFCSVYYSMWAVLILGLGWGVVWLLR